MQFQYKKNDFISRDLVIKKKYPNFIYIFIATQCECVLLLKSLKFKQPKIISKISTYFRLKKTANIKYRHIQIYKHMQHILEKNQKKIGIHFLLSRE